MKSKDILVVFLIIFGLGFSLYRRFSKKNQTGGSTFKQTGSSLPSNPKNDDYEPYSGK
jgi:hypothetical protein